MQNIVKNLLISLINLYKLIISPMLGSGKCRYYPTCSNYAIEAIRKKGVIKGLFMMISRLLRCHPWSSGGYDPVDKQE